MLLPCPVLLLSPDHLNTIRSHAEAAYPQECCGLLLGTLDTAVEEAVRQVEVVLTTANGWNDAVAQELAAEFPSYQSTAANPAPSRGDRYWIDPKDILQAQRQARSLGLEIVGVYHSHPDHPAVPSECDRAIAWSDYSYIIVAVDQGSATDVRSWALDDQRQFQAERMGVPSPIFSLPHLQ